MFGTDSTAASNTFATTVSSGATVYPTAAPLTSQYKAEPGGCVDPTVPTAEQIPVTVTSGQTATPTLPEPALIILPYTSPASTSNWTFDDTQAAQSNPNFSIMYSTTPAPTWATNTNTNKDFGNKEHDDATATNTATFTFTGTSVTWIGTKAKANGEATVTLDGVSQGTFDEGQSSSTSVYQSTIHTWSGLTQGQHILVITVKGAHSAGTGNNVSIDEFTGTAAVPAVLMTTQPNVVVTDTDSACGGNSDYPPTVPNPSTSSTGALAVPRPPVRHLHGVRRQRHDGSRGARHRDRREQLQLHVRQPAAGRQSSRHPLQRRRRDLRNRTMSDHANGLLTARLRSEQGFTLIEVMVALMIGVVVSGATLAIVIVSVHLGSNYTDRVDANQQGRLAMEKITQALNSSCVTPNQAPILAGSTGTSMTFYSGDLTNDNPGAIPNQVTVSLASAQPAPLLMTTQQLTGTAPTWTAASTPATVYTLAPSVAQTVSSGATVPLFQYYGYGSGGALATIAAHARQRGSHRRAGGGDRGGGDQLPGAAHRQREHERPCGRLQRLRGLPLDAAFGLRQRRQPAMRMMSMHTVRRRVRDESGVTVLLALFVLTLTTLILGAVYQAVTNDTQGTRLNVDQGRAYAAAQAGIAQYTYQLNQNPNYWQGCKSVTNVAVPNSTDGGSTEYYSYKPIPATTAPVNDQKCDTANPAGTMIEGGASASPGSFRIEVTGTSQGSTSQGYKTISRSIVAELQAAELPQLRLLHRLRDAGPGRPVQPEQQSDGADRLRGSLPQPR